VETNPCELTIADFENDCYHCRLDGKWCSTDGEWEQCRYNWPLLPELKIIEGGK
jgi:hypothetical protein